jgi:hypothetical protein
VKPVHRPWETSLLFSQGLRNAIFLEVARPAADWGLLGSGASHRDPIFVPTTLTGLLVRVS